MNRRESTASGRPIIPIFANKKKKLRQALYANPSQEISSIKKENSYPGEYSNEVDDCLEMFTNDDKALWGSDSNSNYTENNSISPPSQSNNNCNGYSLTFTNKTGWSYSRAVQNKEDQASQNSRNSSTRQSSNYHTSNSYSKLGVGAAPTLMKHPNATTGNNQNRQFTFAKVSKPGLPVTANSTKGCLQSVHAIQPKRAATRMEESKLQKENKSNNRQINLMKTPVDNSLKLITATVAGMKHWNQYRDQLPVLFEIFGTLDSALSSNTNGTAKNFLIKDETATLRCTFWEMDRKLPRLIRGQMHRCIGAMDRSTETFNCISIRPIIAAERRVFKKYIELSDQAMKEHLSVLKEH